MFKQYKEKLELRLSKLEKDSKEVSKIVGRRDTDTFVLDLLGVESIDKRIDRLEKSMNQLNKDIVGLKNALLEAGIIKQINNEEPILTSKVTSLWGDDSTREYGVVNPVKKAGKKRG